MLNKLHLWKEKMNKNKHLYDVIKRNKLEKWKDLNFDKKE